METPDEIDKNPTFRDKKVDILLKPAKLHKFEHSILNLVNEKID